MNELALFAGAGGGLLASKLLGWTTIGAVEIERYPREVLLQRQRDGMLDKFPIWDDVRTFDGKPWRGIVDVISGGFPCQDISAAGKGKGITGERSGLWKEYARIIGEIRPQFIFAENSPLLRTRGLGVVLQDLASMGYDARWCVLGAWHVGANHRRNRMWVLAYSDKHSGTDCGRTSLVQWELLPEAGREETSNGFDVSCHRKNVADSSELHCDGCKADGKQPEPESVPKPGDSCNKARPVFNWWSTEPDVGRVANGVASRVDRLKAIGNGQVPLVAATAFTILKESMS